ncbi:MAG: glycosyltransferase, partial [Gemmatimonadota bacterium]|nr:glycosyltransferase [Gemmatimonadota bacterium]
ALLEAMAAGLPSVVTWVGGVREITSRETSLIVEVDHATELARAIIRLAKDPFLRQKMGRLAAVRAMAFDVSEWLPRLEAVYDSV